MPNLTSPGRGSPDHARKFVLSISFFVELTFNKLIQRQPNEIAYRATAAMFLDPNMA
jgi:hypothetical protein